MRTFRAHAKNHEGRAVGPVTHSAIGRDTTHRSPNKQHLIHQQIKAERKAGVANSSTRYLLFQDNLDSQKQPDYIECLKDSGVDDHKLPPNETDQVQPIDRGLGRQVKIYLGQQVAQ
jgi:hypothetical protein